MKLSVENREINASGMAGQRKFTVDAGAHIMAVLSGLYKNPIDAMVREYLSNMYDAYVALQRVNPKAEITPPILHAPTALDGNLTFKDFGIGMDLETVWNIYSTYGASTKSGSNDEVGGFGLGSKTAFCYNDGATWTIESRKDGQRHLFMAFIGDDGVPNLTHVNTEPTDEHSGLTISIPIRRQDFQACYEAVQKYAPYFPMELVVEGITVNKRENPLLAGASWSILPTHSRYHVFSNVVMGNVPYAVSYDQIPFDQVKSKKSSYELREFLRYNSFDFRIPIGSVDIVPSRDDLKYTDKTKAAVAAAISTMLNDLGTSIGDRLKACQSEWDAILMVRDIKGISGLMDVVNTIKWQGKTVQPHGVTRKLEDLQKLDPTATVFRYAVTSSDKAAIELTENPATFDMTIDGQQSWLVVDDVPKGAGLLTRALVYNACVKKTHSGRTQRYGHTIGHALLVKTSLTADQISEFFGGMPVNRVQSASQLKGTVTVPQALKSSKDTIYRWSGTSWVARVNAPTVGKVFYYLPLKKDQWSHRWSYTNNRYGSQKDLIQNVRQYAQTMKIETEALYGIKTEDVKNFDATVWVNLVELVESKMIQQIKDNKEMFALSQVDRTDAHMMYQVSLAVQKVSADAKAFVTAMDKIETAVRSPQLQVYNSLVSRMDNLEKTMQDEIKGVAVPNVSKMASALRKKYPMLAVLAEACSRQYYGNGAAELLKNNSAAVLDYVKSIG